MLKHLSQTLPLGRFFTFEKVRTLFPVSKYDNNIGTVCFPKAINKEIFASFQVNFGVPLQLPENTLIIASGVSNSKETRKSEFSREMNLIKNEISKHANSRVIYFSTCSVCSGESSPYIQHKLNMERLVRDANDNCWIFRLPQVVGAVNNSTLVSYFFRAIKTGQMLTIQSQATRNLIDVSDAIRVA